MFDHFNLLAPIYETVIQPKPPERLSELLDLSPELNLLDIGGATGRISQFFADSAKQVVVADTSFKMLQKPRINAACQQSMQALSCCLFKMVLSTES